MVTNTKQIWQIGSKVKVGFLSLIIQSIEPTPGDYAPDRYHLIEPKTLRQYVFTPHLGLKKETT